MAKILVIEDNSNLQALMSDFLNASGFQTLCTNNGRMGLAIVHTYHPDLVLSDVRMPEMDGYALLAALRQDAGTASIPFFFLTAESDVNHQLRTRCLTVEGWLSKPVDPLRLVAMIRQQLARRSAGTNQAESAQKSGLTACLLS